MDDRDWLILHTLYKEKSITKAGQSLYIAQPTLTKRLKQIEKDLGVIIVHRGIRGVQFTPEGEYLAKRAEEMLITLREIKEDLQNFSHQVAGTLRLGVSNFFGKYKLPGLLRQFKELHPTVEFQVETGFSQDVFNLVYNQDVHIGFVRGNYSWPDQKKLVLEEQLCIASKNNIDLNELPRLPRIDYRTDSLYKRLVDDWWAEHYTDPPSVAMVVDQGDTCKEMVMNGLGYAIIPSMFFEHVEDVYKFYITDKKGHPLIRKTWMFYHEELLKLNVVRAFVHFIEDENNVV